MFDYTQWAEPLREELRQNAERLAAEARLEIEFIRRHGDFRKEARIQDIIAQRGDHPGLVHVFSAMEPCASYRPWYDKPTHTASLKSTPGKCLHYYFYFIDPQFGLCYVRVPTWAPFRLEVYFNGHGWLARQMTAAGIAFTAADNAFLSIADPLAAQRLADGLDAQTLHQHLDQWATHCCTILRQFRAGYHWSLMQVEFASKDRSRRGFNLFLEPDYRLFLTLGRGEWSISGFRAADLRAHLPDLSASRASYLLKRLRVHGLIKKIARCYKYYLTKLGRRVLVTALVIREYFVQPTLVSNAL